MWVFEFLDQNDGETEIVIEVEVVKVLGVKK
jgi:hypothetical protein